MICPICSADTIYKRLDTRHMTDGRVYRHCQCSSCGGRFNTIEAYVPDGKKPNINHFRRNNAKVIWKPEPKPMAFIKRR